MSANTGKLLNVSDLSIGFGAKANPVEVVHHVGFDLAPGETLALVGESGSGKSVTALSVNRLIDFGGGHILSGKMMFERRDGSVIDLATADERVLGKIRGGEIGMIFQEPMTSLNPVKKVGKQIAEALRLHQHLEGQQADKAVKAMLDRVRIPDATRRMQQYPHQLSGGMRQRIMIAMALACNPRLLIADEPTTALDVTVQAQIMALLAELKRELQMAMIFITHDIGLVAEVADRVVVMQNGEIVEQGELGKVLDAPQHEYTKHLLSAVPQFRHGAEARAAELAESGADPDGRKSGGAVSAGQPFLEPPQRCRTCGGRGRLHAEAGRDAGDRRGKWLGQIHHGKGGAGSGQRDPRRDKVRGTAARRGQAAKARADGVPGPVRLAQSAA